MQQLNYQPSAPSLQEINNSNNNFQPSAPPLNEVNNVLPQYIPPLPQFHIQPQYYNQWPNMTVLPYQLYQYQCQVEKSQPCTIQRFEPYNEQSCPGYNEPPCSGYNNNCKKNNLMCCTIL